MKIIGVIRIALALVGLLTVLGVAIAFLIADIPPVAQQVTPGQLYITTRIAAPRPGDSLPLNLPARVAVSAVGQSSLRRLELWADGERVAGMDVPDKTSVSQIDTSWNWTPTRVGSAALVLRAYDRANHIALSNVVRVNVAPTPLVRHVLQSGDTLESLAKQNNVAVEAIVAANPGFKAGDALPAGAGINIPTKAPSAPGSDGAAPNAPAAPPSAPPNGPGGIQTAITFGKHIAPDGNIPVTDMTGTSVNKLAFWFNQNIIGRVQGPAQIFPYSVTPAFDVGVQGCSASLRMQPPGMPGVNVQTYLVYRLDPFSTDYTLLVALPGSGPGLVEGFLDTNLFGKFSYYVTAVMAPDQQQLTSDMMNVEISDKACNHGQWAAVIVTQSRLSTNPPMAGGVYCYLTLNNTPWGRIPKVGTLNYNVGSDYDLKSSMPYITMAPLPDTVDVSLECWGYNGGQLVSLGTGTASYHTGGPAAVVITASGFTATIVFDKGAPLPGQQLAPSALTPPTALRLITTRQDCISHLGPWGDSGNPCDYMFDPSMAYFAYEWGPAVCPAGVQACAQDNQIRGFNIYMLAADGSLYRYDSNQPDRKQFEIPRLSDGTACFIVRSYTIKSGFVESANSNIACASSATVKIEKLTPVEAHTETVNNSVYLGCGPFTPPPSGINSSLAPSSGPVKAGYNYSNYLFNPAAFISCKVINNHYSRAVAWFDPDFGREAGPLKAILSFDRSGPAACGTQLNAVTQRNGDNVTNFDPLVLINPGISHSIDVTQSLDKYFGGENNGIFMINSSYENANALDSKQCAETFTNFSLMLTYPYE